MADNKDDRDVNELSPEEAQALAVERSNASKEDFDPTKDDHDPANSVVELGNHESVFVKDLVDHEDPVIASDAQSVVDGNFPGGPNYPNGPAEDQARKDAAPKPAPVKSTDTQNQSNQS